MYIYGRVLCPPTISIHREYPYYYIYVPVVDNSGMS